MTDPQDPDSKRPLGSTLDWSVRKVQHIQLSDEVADRYDEIYEQANFATGSYMQYEVELIQKYAQQAPSNSIAVDLGCGTGRDSRVLAKYFDQVYGYDFSSNMIKQATSNKLENRLGNILYEVRDVEDERLPFGDATIAMVNTAFGMGSFVSNPEVLFREVRRVLMPRGIAIFSFYNANALVNQLTLDWKPALAARVQGASELHVEFEGKSYDIPARAYQPEEIRRKMEGMFALLEMSTFPTLSALFPQSLFENITARQLCSDVDKSLALNMEIAAGPYIVGVCRKGGAVAKELPLSGYARVLSLLKRHNIDLDIREHGPVRNMSDVRAVLDVPEEQMVKSVLISVNQDKTTENTDPTIGARLFLAAIPADRSLHLGKIARVLGRSRESIKFATQIQVEEIAGFQIGSIPPFGLPSHIPVILDSRLESHRVVWCGTGKATESLRVSMQNLKIVSQCVVEDISKPKEPK